MGQEETAPDALKKDIDALESEVASVAAFFEAIDQGHEAEIPGQVVQAAQAEDAAMAAPQQPKQERTTERDPAKAVPHLRDRSCESSAWPPRPPAAFRHI